MTNSPSLQAFVRTLEEEIENSKEQGSTFSVVVLATQPGITASERAKLLHWGEVVLRNHAPDAAMVTADPERHRCLILLRRGATEGAEDLACCYGEQLNKLPVFGIAPGEGWHWDFAMYPKHRDGIHELRDGLISPDSSA